LKDQYKERYKEGCNKGPDKGFYEKDIQFFDGAPEHDRVYLQAMNAAKLQLSKEELALVRDPSWILTKNSIIAKVMELLGELCGEYREAASYEHHDAGQGTGIPLGTPKISRGENYKGLPWVVLDYPRLFGKEDIFAIRTLFWWGHYFSLTLHLKGKWKEMYLPILERNQARLASAGFHAGIAGDEWKHEHSEETYEKLQASSPRLEMVGRDFLKLGVKCPLDNWEQASAFLLEKFRVLVDAMQDQFPNR
jgi:hypothetical protein